MDWHCIGNKSLTEPIMTQFTDEYIDDLVQDCSISIANALELLQSCTKLSIFIIRPELLY